MAVDLRYAAAVVCEADHIRRIFFAAWWLNEKIGNGPAASGLVTVRQRQDDGSTSSMAIGRQPTALAVDVDRRHRGRFPSGDPRGSLRPTRARRLSCAACASGLRWRRLRLHLQPAKLKSPLTRPPIAAAAAFFAQPRAVWLLRARCSLASAAEFRPARGREGHRAAANELSQEITHHIIHRSTNGATSQLH